MAPATPDYTALYPTLGFDRPSDGVLRITLDAPGLNSVSPECHSHLADVWTSINRDPSVKVAIIRGAGKAFSSGGSFELLDELVHDPAARLRALREARDIVTNVIDCSKPIVSAIHGPAVGAGHAQVLHRHALAVEHAEDIVVGRDQQLGRIGEGFVQREPGRIGVAVRADDRQVLDFGIQPAGHGARLRIRWKQAIRMKFQGLGHDRPPAVERERPTDKLSGDKKTPVT